MFIKIDSTLIINYSRFFTYAGKTYKSLKRFLN